MPMAPTWYCFTGLCFKPHQTGKRRGNRGRWWGGVARRGGQEQFYLSVSAHTLSIIPLNQRRGVGGRAEVSGLMSQAGN